MIVISGALVLVALVLLVVGLTMTELDFVYASIAVSLLAFVFLIIGILQRRGEQVTAAEPAPAPAPTGSTPGSSTVQVVPSAPIDVSKRPAAEAEPPLEDDDVDEELLEGGGIVLVVAGRPRYHVDGCRYLNGKDVEEVDVLDARDEGFTPCGVCKPDEVLAAELAEEAEDGDVVDEEGLAEEEQLAGEEDFGPADDEDDLLEDDLDEDDVDDLVAADVAAAVPSRGSRALPPAETQTLPLPETAPAAKAARRTAAAKAPVVKAPATTPARKVAAKTPAAAATKVPARSAAARSVPAAAKAAAAPVKLPVKSPAKAAVKAPVPTTPVKAAAAASTPAATTAAGKGSVVVIPDRGRFHRADCRYVRDAADALELTRAQATKQGYDACGVCKP